MRLIYFASSMTADDLTTQGAKALSSMVYTYFSQDILVPAPEGP